MNNAAHATRYQSLGISCVVASLLLIIIGQHRKIWIAWMNNAFDRAKSFYHAMIDGVKVGSGIFLFCFGGRSRED